MEDWILAAIIIGAILGTLIITVAAICLGRLCCKRHKIAKTSANTPPSQLDVENQTHENNVPHCDANTPEGIQNTSLIINPASKNYAVSSGFEIINEEDKHQKRQQQHQQQHHQDHQHREGTLQNDGILWARRVEESIPKPSQGGSSQGANESSRQQSPGIDPDKQGERKRQLEDVRLVNERWALRVDEVQKQQGLQQLLRQRQQLQQQLEQQQQQSILLQQRQLQLQQEEQRQRLLLEEKKRQQQLQQQQQQQQLLLQQQQQKQLQQQRDNFHKQQRKNELLQRVLHQGQQRQRQNNVQNLGQQLDLHSFSLRDAMEAFKLFLKVAEDEYNDCDVYNSRQKRFVFVITGRGKHSANGPVIKPAVENYLLQHDYAFSWSNPGMVRIDLLKRNP